VHEEQDPLLAAQEQEQAQASQIDLTKFKELAERAWIKKAEHKAKKQEMEEACSTIWADYQELERELLRFMEGSKLDKFVADSCTLARTSKDGVKIADKNLLLTHLSEKGHLLNVLRLNVTDVTKYFQEQQNIAEGEGNLDYSLPGVEKAATYYTLSMRKR